MEKSKKKMTRIPISIIFVLYGATTLIGGFEALLTLELSCILSFAWGILMFLSGAFGLIGKSKKLCRTMAIVICVLAALNFVLALVRGRFDHQTLVYALLSWIYFDCI